LAALVVADVVPAAVVAAVVAALVVAAVVVAVAPPQAVMSSEAMMTMARTSANSFLVFFISDNPPKILLELAFFWILHFSCWFQDMSESGDTFLLELLLGLAVCEERILDGVEIDSEQDDQALGNILEVEFELDHVHAIVDDSEDQ